MLLPTAAKRFDQLAFVHSHIFSSMFSANRDAECLLQQGLLVQHPQVQISHGHIFEFIAQPRRFNRFHNGEVNLFIPIPDCFFVTNFALLFNAHIVPVNSNVLLKQRIIFHIVKTEINTR